MLNRLPETGTAVGADAPDPTLRVFRVSTEVARRGSGEWVLVRATMSRPAQTHFASTCSVVGSGRRTDRARTTPLAPNWPYLGDIRPRVYSWREIGRWRPYSPKPQLIVPLKVLRVKEPLLRASALLTLGTAE